MSTAALQTSHVTQATPLRVVICGSVDDGKSTLIGRLLADTGSVPDDQMVALQIDSERYGTAGTALDYALLVDGLNSERTQGITIDVAYRYFSTPKRSFIIADTPGHVEYTRNMATGASLSDAAIVLVSAHEGILDQTLRHSSIAYILGIRYFFLVVNKMDLVNYSEECFRKISDQFHQFLMGLGVAEIHDFPVVARDGANLANRCPKLSWYKGKTLLSCLENIRIENKQRASTFRMPVQWVNRPTSEFRGYSGTVTAGEVQAGDEVIVLPSGKKTNIHAISSFHGNIGQASAGNAITLLLDDQIDISRGDVICNPSSSLAAVDQLSADIIWLGDSPLLSGRSYLMKFGTKTVTGLVTSIQSHSNFGRQEPPDSKTLPTNSIGRCHVSLSQPVVIDTYASDRSLGSFIVIDKITKFTVGAGMVTHELRRAQNVQRQQLAVTPQLRSMTLGQKPCCIWLTGLSGSGKSTVASALETRLNANGRHTFLLDGDNVRLGLNRDLGFSDADRVENIRRVAEVAKLMCDAGLIVLVAMISPFETERNMARELFEPGTFIEVFVDAPIGVCEARDVKGLYRKARAGLLENFTGISSPYERPTSPSIHLSSDGRTSVEQLVDQVMSFLDTLVPV